MVGRIIHFDVGMIHRSIACEAAAPGHHPAIRQEQSHGVIVARHPHPSYRAPQSSTGVPYFPRQHGTGITQFLAGGIAPDDEDFPGRKDNPIGKAPDVGHGGDLRDRGRVGIKIDSGGEMGRSFTAAGCQPSGHEEPARLIHHDGGIFGIPGAWPLGSRSRDGAIALGVYPVHGFGRPSMEEPAVGGYHNERRPVRLNAGLGCDRTPVYIVILAPVGPIVALGGVVATAAGNRKHIPQRQGHGGRIPAGIIHIRSPGPGIGLPVENAGEPHRISSAHNLEPAVGTKDGAAAKHIVLVPIQLGHGSSAGIPHCRIGKLRPVWKGSALV